MMNLPLPTDKFRNFLHHIQHSVDCIVPVSQQDLLILDRCEVYHSIDTVYSATDRSCIVENTELILTCLQLNPK